MQNKFKDLNSSKFNCHNLVGNKLRFKHISIAILSNDKNSVLGISVINHLFFTKRTQIPRHSSIDGDFFAFCLGVNPPKSKGGGGGGSNGLHQGFFDQKN